MPSCDSHSLLAYSTLIISPGTAGTSFAVQTGEGARFAVGQQVTYWPANVLPHKGNAEVGRITATCAGYVRRFTRLSIPRVAGRSSEEAGSWVAHLTLRRKPRGTAAWWESENGQKVRMAGAREARAIG